MIEIDKIYNEDCLIGMQKIDDKSIDCIICDLPYGTTKCSWDIIIPFDKLWGQYNRIIKDNGAIILFGQEPFSSLLRVSNLKDYRYDIYWQKERLTNIMQVKRRVGKDVETISIFYKNQCTYNPQMVKYDGPKRGNKVKNGKLGKMIKDLDDLELNDKDQITDIFYGTLHPNLISISLGKHTLYADPSILDAQDIVNNAAQELSKNKDPEIRDIIQKATTTLLRKKLQAWNPNPSKTSSK